MRIGIVNDLRLAVEALRRAVVGMPGASVAWTASDGEEAVRRCAADLPDVVLMDMIMPVMDGVEATRRIMKATPCPILVVTATVEGNASKVFEALGAGALDAVATPGIGADGKTLNAEPLQRKIRALAMIARCGEAGAHNARPSAGPLSSPGVRPQLVAIGCSTGGPMAVAAVIRNLPASAPWPIVIVQHIDPDFARGFADWLTRETGREVAIVRDGQKLVPGQIVTPATGDHLILARDGTLRITADPVDQPFRPSVDVFFDSLADAARPGVAVVLTGMGRDGAAGMAALRKAGWRTIAQDRETSVVWGMPGACVQSGAAMEVAPLPDVGRAVVGAMQALKGVSSP